MFPVSGRAERVAVGADLSVEWGVRGCNYAGVVLELRGGDFTEYVGVGCDSGAGGALGCVMRGWARDGDIHDEWRLGVLMLTSMGSVWVVRIWLISLLEFGTTVYFHGSVCKRLLRCFGEIC